MKKNGKKFRDVPMINAIIITLLFMVFLSLSHVFTIFLEQLNLDFIVSLVLHFLFRFSTQVILVLLILALILGFITNKRLSKDFFSFIHLTKENSNNKAILVGILAFFGFWFPSLIISLVLGIYNADINLLIGTPDSSTGNLGWFIFILAIIPGIWEELGFRGLMLSNLKEKYSERTSVLISAIFFSLFHFANLVRQPLDLVLFGAIMGFILGASWGYLVNKSNNLIPAILAHYLVDALAFYFVLTDSASITSILIMYVIVSLISVTITFLLAKFFFKREN